MCGINGIISNNQSLDLSEINQMNCMIKHRGPDGEGILKHKNILLGHVRLSIQDLSSKGHQPMSRDNKKWIIFNGEIYNFKQIREELKNNGHKFFSKTDTEVILAAYEEWGFKCFEKFNGMWVFAILDKEKDEILICRDRYGIKPCYIAKLKNKIIFSSEIKGIIASNENFIIDNNAAFYSNDIIREKYFKTIFKDIEIIEPGHTYLINTNNLEVKKSRWWQGLNKIPSINPNKKNIQNNLIEKLTEATKIRLVSDVKIATSLSGGVDSSIIFSILNKLEKNNLLDLNPFILNYSNNKTFKAALNFTEHLSKKPTIINTEDTLDSNTLNELDETLSTLETTSIYFKQLVLYRTQKEKGFKVSIDGHGADESLGGYARFFPYLSMQFINSLADSYGAIFNTKGNKVLEKKIKEHGLPNLKNKFILNSTNFFLKESKDNINRYSSISPSFDPPDSFLEDKEILKDFDYQFQIQYLDATYGNLQWLLNKWDKASMSSSVEIRSPFLDWNFFQYALSIPGYLKVENGENKSILRQAFKNYLTKEILDLKIKQGLPRQKEKFDQYMYDFITNITNQNDFLNHISWDGKRISNDFKNIEKREDVKRNVWEVILIYLQQKGYIKKRKHCIDSKNSIVEKFNLLEH